MQPNVLDFPKFYRNNPSLILCLSVINSNPILFDEILLSILGDNNLDGMCNTDETFVNLTIAKFSYSHSFINKVTKKSLSS
jgi:hypothetical protein